jgi:glycosidase
MSINKINFWLVWMIAFILINLSINQGVYAQAGFNDDRVMLQGFYWESYRHGHPDKFPEFGDKKWYELVKEQAEAIRAGRFDLIWLPPPSYAGKYSAGYNPKEYFQLDNSYGSFDQHRAMLEALLENGIEPVADIVINHRDGSTGWAGFEDPKWGTWSICRSDEAFSNPASEVFNTLVEERGAEEERPEEYTSHGGTTYQYDSFRDLDHTNEIVQCDIINYLKQLQSMGYRGWRYDMVHGFHAKRLAQYNQATQPTFSVGEYDWDKDDEQRGWVWYSATTPGNLETASSVFDFRTHFILKDNKGNYTAWYGNGNGIGKLGDNTDGHPWRNKAVTFLENHDSGYRTNEDGTPQPGHEHDNFANNWEVEQAYAYILTHPGVPIVYWKHYFDWGSKLRNKITALINARKVARVTAGSKFYPQNNAKDNGVYAAYIVGKDGALYVRIGGDDNSWQPYFSGYHDYREYAYGNGWKVWVALPDNPDEVKQAPFKDAFSVPGYETPVSCAISPPPPQQLTIHYHRPDNDYDGWGLHLWGAAIDNPTDWNEPLPFTGQDDCGQFAIIDIQHPGEQLGLIVHKGDQKDINEDRYFTPTSEQSEIWLVKDDATIHNTQQPSNCTVEPLPTQKLTIYYHRPNNDYQDWGLHLWGDAVNNPTDWNNPLPFTGQDECRQFAVINVYPGKILGFIVHKGDQKDINANRYFTPTSEQSAIWLVENETAVYTTPKPIDCKAPVTVALIAADDPEKEGNVVLTATTSCGTVVFYANANPIQEYSLETSHSMTWDTTALSNGIYDVTAAVYDKTGNLSATSESVEVVVDRNNEVDFREETIYFLLTARFYDGDPDNNYYNRDRLKEGDPQWRGDFKGLIEKLDYIKDLGFTAIWITPPVTNRSGLDYHGYHAYDWTKIDPRLESPEATYQDLINAAHAKGLKVIQDVVINHSSNYGIRDQVWIDHLPIKYYRPEGGAPIDHGPYQGNLGDYKSPYREDNDNSKAPDWFKERQTSDPEGDDPLIDPETGEILPQSGYRPERFFNVTEAGAQELDPNWYHLDGYMKGGDWESPVPLQRKHLAGDTMDLATENQNVKDYLNNAIFTYLDMGVDAIRLDTLKHIERGNVLEYVNAWKAHKPTLFVFGENLVKGTGWGDLGGDNGPSDIRPWWYTRLGNDKHDPNSGGDSGLSVLDFSLFSTFRDNLSHGHFGGIGGILSMDWVYGNATKLVTFLQNHDVGPDNDFKYRFQGEQWMAAVAYNLLWTIRGIPCLYYGEEIEFMKGAPQDIAGNNDTLDMTGRAYFGDHLLNENLAETQNYSLYKHIQRLNLIRRNIPALQKASMSAVNEWDSGMSFIRDYNNGESYVVVGLAAGNDQDITVNGVKNGTYRDAVTGNTVEVSNGTLSFYVKGKSAGIYLLNGPGKIGEDGMYLK